MLRFTTPVLVAAMLAAPDMLERLFRSDLPALGFPAGPGAAAVPTGAELQALPAPAQRYLAFTEAAARPRAWSYRATVAGRSRPGPGRAMEPCQTWQYATNVAIARYTLTWTNPPRAVPRITRAVYADGHGWSLTELLGLLPTAGATGPVLDRDDLAAYLGEAVLLAPAMLLPPVARWYRIDDRSFEVALADHGQEVVGTAAVDANGRLERFSTPDRAFLDPMAPDRDPVPARWSAVVGRWSTVDGRRLPAAWTTTWELPAGAFEQAEHELVPGKTAFNVAPGG